MSVRLSPTLTPRAAVSPARLNMRSRIVSGDPLSASMPHSARAGAVTPVFPIRPKAEAVTPVTPIKQRAGARSPVTPMTRSFLFHSPRAQSLTSGDPLSASMPHTARAGAVTPASPMIKTRAGAGPSIGVTRSFLFHSPRAGSVTSGDPLSASMPHSTRAGAGTPATPIMKHRAEAGSAVTLSTQSFVRTASPNGLCSPKSYRERVLSPESVVYAPPARKHVASPSSGRTSPQCAYRTLRTESRSRQCQDRMVDTNCKVAPVSTERGTPTVRAVMTSVLNNLCISKSDMTTEPKTPSTLMTPASKFDLAHSESEKTLSGKANNLITPAAKLNHANMKKKYLEEKQEHLIFNWLAWAPQPRSLCYQALHQHFPGALPGEVINNRIKRLLQAEEYGFDKANTLVGYSLCPDEINYEPGCLVDLMKKEWGHAFPLGGISGAPFVGVTGFAAFSHHVPDDGNIVIIFGPHVAVSREGLIGKVRREGQHHLSTACGAVIGAYNACCAAGNNKDDEDEYNPADMQMGWIKSQLQAHIGLIEAQSNPMAALAYQAYEMVKAKLENIVNLDFGIGKLVLIGGIQINMPDGFQEHFLPLSLDIRQKGKPSLNLLSAFDCDFSKERIDFARAWTPQIEGEIMPSKDESSIDTERSSSGFFKEFRNVKAANFDHSVELAFDQRRGKQHAVFAWLSWSPEPGTPLFKTLHREFPGALPGPGVHHRLKMVLTEQYGFTTSNTLFGTSICPDEINHERDDLAALMATFWGSVFPLGGLAGVPFAGKTGFKAFSHHVPVNGDIIVLYGPHVGISATGEVGKFPRTGQKELSTACGACIGAYNACVAEGGGDIEFDEVDIQMSFIKSQLAPHAKRIQRQQCPMAALAYQAFEVVKNKVNKVVNTEFGSGRLVLIGGIQINMPNSGDGDRDHFLPLSCEVRQAGKSTYDIGHVFHMPESGDDEDSEEVIMGA